MYKIGELSKLCHLPVKTLRYYDSEGLLIPDRIDKFTGYRYYSAARIADCNRIIALKELGFSLAEIKQHMKASRPEDILALMDVRRTELESALSQTTSQLKQLACIRRIITEGEMNMFDMVIRSMDTLHVAGIRKIFKTKEDAYATAQSIQSALSANMIGRQMIIINYETEYREYNFDLAACVEITGKLPKGSEYYEKTILFPDEAASLVCSRNELEAAYRFMARRLEETACQITGAFYEIYHDDGTVELKVPVCRLLNDPVPVDDNAALPFENDAEVIGKWKFIDKVPSAEQFCPDRPKYSDSNNIWLKELYFLPAGKGYWIVDSWTKGSLTTSFGYPKHTCRHHYSIQQQNGKTFMFIEMKDDFYRISRGGKPEIHVFEKVSDQEYTQDEIRIHDRTDMPFVPDPAALGKWIVQDLVDHPDCFSPGVQNFPKDGLFFRSISLEDNGNALVQYKGKPVSPLKWTNGFLLDQKNSIAEAYVVRRIDGVEYLLIEWKSGDYLFGGRRPDWYVFTRES